MYLTIISGYELGQFLRILLWVCVPIAMFALLVTTWLQYRRRQLFSKGLLLSMEGVSAGEEGSMNFPGEAHGAAGLSADPGIDMEGDGQSRDGRVEEQGRRVADVFGEEDYKENLYRGILWMKEKYEQYREMADQRYDRLKDELAKVERRYEELLASLEQSRPVVGAKPAEPMAGLERTTPVEPTAQLQQAVQVERTTQFEPTAQLETGIGEPIMLVDPVGMESVVVAEAGPLGEVAEAEPRVWNQDPKTEMADIPVAEREERTHAQAMEEQSARTRQRLEEELGRVRHQLEEEVARSRRQQDEQAAVMETNRHLEQQMVYSNRQLEEKQRIITDLEGQLRSDKQKIEELVTKLRNNSQLLMKIYQELDKSLHFNDIPKEG